MTAMVIKYGTRQRG